MKKILMAALLLIMSSQALFADEDKPELSFYGFIDDWYAFFTFSRPHSFGKIFFNAGYVSHTGDSSYAPSTNYKSAAVVLEFMMDHKWFHLLGASYFKVGDSDGFHPVKSAYRVEAGFKYKGLFLGGFYDSNILTDTGKGRNNGSSFDKADARIGGLIGYEFEEGVNINFEAYDQWYSYNSNKHDNLFSLQFLFEGDFDVKISD